MLKLVAIGSALIAALGGCTGPNRVYVDATSTTGNGGASTTSTTGGQTVTSTTSTATATGSTSTGATCSDAMHTCLEQAPAGWVGPYELDQVMSPGAPLPCNGNYGTLVADYNGSIDEGMPVCDCHCDPATGIGCTLSATICLTSNCIQGCTSGTALPPFTCTSLGGVPFGADVFFTDPSPTQMGSCQPNPTKTIPTPSWGIAARVCSGTTSPAGCAGGQVCAPVAAGSDQLCILSSGDVPCPDSFYATKNTFYASFSDSRDCTTCTCGGATSDCGGTMNLQMSLNNSPCGPPSSTLGEGSRNAGSCGVNPQNFDAVVYNPSPSGTCQHFGGALTGTVTKNGATTVCCH